MISDAHARCQPHKKATGLAAIFAIRPATHKLFPGTNKPKYLQFHGASVKAVDNSEANALMQLHRAKRHFLLVYSELIEFIEFYCTYATSQLDQNRSVVIISSRESAQEVYKSLHAHGIAPEMHEKGRLRAINPTENSLTQFRSAAALVDTLDLHRDNQEAISVLMDFSGIRYESYEDRLLPIRLHEAIDSEVSKRRQVQLVCCYELGHFREEYSVMMKERMLNCHSMLIELNCQLFR
jgi:hypothetical protein